MFIENQNGIKEIELKKLEPIEAWILKENFTSFANSKDNEFRSEYVMRVLKPVCAVLGDHHLPLSTRALIDNHLGSVENIEKVFINQLEFNGISVKECCEKVDRFTFICNEIATSFTSECMISLVDLINFIE